MVLSPLSGGFGEGETPLPIPNREVKPLSADGTWPSQARESRTPPVFSFHEPPRGAARRRSAWSRADEDVTSATSGHARDRPHRRVRRVLHRLRPVGRGVAARLPRSEGEARVVHRAVSRAVTL